MNIPLLPKFSRTRKEAKINTQVKDKSSYFQANKNQIRDVML